MAVRLIVPDSPVLSLPMKAPFCVSSKCPTPKESITISIDRNQRIYWNGTRVGQGHIATRVQEAIAQNPKQQIVLQADKSTPYVRIISVLDAIRSSGCSNVMLEAEKT